MRMIFDPDRTYEVPGYVLDRIQQIASRLNTDIPFGPFELRDLAQEIQAKLDSAEGPVDDEAEVYVEEDETDPSTEPCQVCGSQELTLLGVLATVTHYRCRHCGWTQSVGVEEVAS